jgi:hypothetical protein
MRRSLARGAVAAAIAVAAAACGSQSAAATDSALAQPVVTAPPPEAYDSLAVCPATGNWHVCTLMYRLKRAGFTVERDTVPVRNPRLAQVGMRLRLARGEMTVFLYPDSTNRRLDERHLDSTTLISPDAGSVPGRLTMVRSANMLVLSDVRNERLRERVMDALLAGPPQPPSASPVILPPAGTKR